MHDLRLTHHAETRMRQRGFRNVDVSLVLSVATRVADDAFFLSDKDAAREIERRRRGIQRQLERLRGTKLTVGLRERHRRFTIPTESWFAQPAESLRRAS